MTETEWLTCSDAFRSIFFVKRAASERQLRLAAAACCRDIWPLLTDVRSQEVVKEVEAVADGNAKFSQDRGKFRDACEARRELAARPQPSDSMARKQFQATIHASQAAVELNWHFIPAVGGVIVSAATTMKMWSRSLGLPGRVEARKYRARQHRVLVDIFGNPFRPVSADPSWLTSTVVALAQGIDADRAFDRLPILADALMDAGCENTDILDHCRSEGLHVRGCWLVDLLTGRK